MNNIADITFIYDTKADICLLKEGKSIRELTVKGPCDYQGVINGTWFQIDELVSHWVSFRWNKFNSWQVFYKCVQSQKIAYYRQLFSWIKGILVFSFTERDEWVKDPLSKKMKESRYCY